MNAGVLAPGYAPPDMPRPMLGVPQPVPMPYAMTAGDPHWRSVSLLVRMDGRNGSTTFTDRSINGYTVSRVGDTVVTTDQSVFGSSAYFDGAGDYLSIPYVSAMAFGTGDFTIEYWVRPTNLAASISGQQGIINYGANGFASSLWAGTVHTAQANVADLNDFLSTGIANNRWAFVALARQSGTMRGFVNGVLVGTVTGYTRNFTGSSAVWIGTVGGGLVHRGYLSELRVTRGVARYTSSFAPPTAPFPER